MRSWSWFSVAFMVSIAAAVLFATQLSHAKMIEGHVAFVDLRGDFFKIHAEDPLTGEKKNLEIVVTQDTKFEGVNSILELGLGDDISVKAEPAEGGQTWKASSIKVSASEISGEDAAPFGDDKPESWTEKSEASANPMEDEEVTPTAKKTNRLP